ncbi:MAG: hypothetical protein DI533_22720 [Cereibacter sphaeroides]|uniref:Uncharacterized protein n=2 Tax=Alphaproteobacteria TaxID=28211 RepID=A0A2W5RTZ0_CERSP|nr:hypothetical protein A7X12_23200 [Sphingomonas sp. TDK1]PZQ94148.1 MAG: hypothetical protein DI533_22720 [Cereibacter sphaeroides]
MQTVSGADVAKPRRISEELYYLDPYQRGAYSCDRQVAKQQGRIFRRRFEKRIEALKQKEASVLGSDPGFDVVPLKQCTPSDVVRSTKFVKALNQFDVDLGSLEAKMDLPRKSGEFP